MAQLTQDTTPWFKQFWPWFLIGFPAASIVYCGFMIFYAITSENSLVSDNYYKDGLAINQVLAMDELAKQLHLNADVNFDDNGRVAAVVTGDFESPPPFLTLKLLHPTLDGQDMVINLLPEPNGHYSAMLEKPLKGRWYIDVIAHDSTWRLKGEGAFPSSVATVLTAN